VVRPKGLVGLGGVDVQGSDEGGAAEDRDAVAVLEHGDGQLLVAAADVDSQLTAAGWPADGDGAAGTDVGAVDLGGGWQRPVGRDRGHLG
jgi:hypothetical protein